MEVSNTLVAVDYVRCDWAVEGTQITRFTVLLMNRPHPLPPITLGTLTPMNTNSRPPARTQKQAQSFEPGRLHSHLLAPTST